MNWYSNNVTSRLKNQTLIKESSDLLNVHVHVIKKTPKYTGHQGWRLQKSAKVNNTYTVRVSTELCTGFKRLEDYYCLSATA